MKRLLLRLAYSTIMILAAATATAAAAQTPRKVQTYVHTRNYTVANGLSSNHVYGIIQDAYGFIWIGTNNGSAGSTDAISDATPIPKKTTPASQATTYDG